MLRVLSRERMRAFDRNASAICGVESSLLMENAGRGAAERIARELDLGAAAHPRVVVVAGTGNNGGDGYVVARRLALLGAFVHVLGVGPEERLRGDALSAQRAWLGVGGGVTAFQDQPRRDALLGAATAVVDAVFGTGLSRSVEGLEREAIEAINAAPGRRFALDLPSGLDADSGAVLGAAVFAELTLTFGAHKLGLLTPNGARHAGRVVLIDIGLPSAAPPEVGESAWLIEPADARRVLVARSPAEHKVSAGRVLVLAGSPGKLGAALLVARGAQRAGAGLVTLAGLPAVADALDRRVVEAMTARLDPGALEASLAPLLEHADVVAIGPGLGLDAAARELVERVVLGHAGPIVVDADALTAFAGRAHELTRAAGTLVLTPHPGEMARLVGGRASDVEADRFAALARGVAETHATLLLKGPHTLVGAPNTLTCIGARGTPALATGGAGDVLTGVIAALACRLPPFTAAWAGAYLHATAGSLWARDTGADRGLLASEIADGLPRALAELAASPSTLPV